MGEYVDYCRRALGFIGMAGGQSRSEEAADVPMRNPGRELALIGVRKRRQSQRERYRQVHDEMRARLGLLPIVWRD